jgi:hypothetical protein
VAPLEEDPTLAYVGTWVQYMESDGTPIVDELGGYMPYGNWSRLIERNNVGGVCSCLIRRRLFDLGFSYSRELTSYEDWLLYWELNRAGHQGAIVPERLFHYRVRPASMMREVGAPRLERLLGEIHAHLLEREVEWTRSDAIRSPTANERDVAASEQPPDDEVVALRRANAELRAANVRLAEGQLGIRDAAAAALVFRYDQALESARERIAELQARDLTAGDDGRDHDRDVSSGDRVAGAPER